MALVVPELPVFAEIASKVLEKTVDKDDKGALATAADDARVKKEVLKLLDLAAKDSDLQGYVSGVLYSIIRLFGFTRWLRPSFYLRLALVPCLILIITNICPVLLLTCIIIQSNRFEKIKKIKIVIEAFTADNKMMTPTFKLRRREIQTQYKEDLDALYQGSS